MAEEHATTDTDARPDDFRAMPHAVAKTEKRSLIRRLSRRFNLAVVACILALAVLLGVLNNLRVAEECRVKWLGEHADQTVPVASNEVTP